MEHVISGIAIVSFEIEAAGIYTQILHNLSHQNITIGTHDMIIAASVIANGCSVITMDGKDFNRIKGLTVLNIEDIDK